MKKPIKSVNLVIILYILLFLLLFNADRVGSRTCRLPVNPVEIFDFRTFIYNYIKIHIYKYTASKTKTAKFHLLVIYRKNVTGFHCYNT